MARTQLTGSQVKDTSIGNADIQAGAVTNDKMADMLASRIKGRITSTGAVQDLTVAEVLTMLGIDLTMLGRRWGLGASILTGGGAVSMSANGNTVTWSSDMYLIPLGNASYATINAASVTIGNFSVVYVVVPDNIMNSSGMALDAVVADSTTYVYAPTHIIIGVSSYGANRVFNFANGISLTPGKSFNVSAYSSAFTPDSNALAGQMAAYYLSRANHSGTQEIDTIAGLATALAAKLDSSVYTASDVLAKLLSVDGRGSGILADNLGIYAPYAFNATNTPRSYPTGVSISFVSATEGFPSYGGLFTINGYSTAQDGGVFQLYVPYNATYGGNYAQYRMGLYNNAGWTAWKPFGQSATDLLTLIKGVDGPSSGLNADLLDDRHYYDVATFPPNGKLWAISTMSGAFLAEYTSLATAHSECNGLGIPITYLLGRGTFSISAPLDFTQSTKLIGCGPKLTTIVCGVPDANNHGIVLRASSEIQGIRLERTINSAVDWKSIIYTENSSTFVDCEFYVASSYACTKTAPILYSGVASAVTHILRNCHFDVQVASTTVGTDSNCGIAIINTMNVAYTIVVYKSGCSAVGLNSWALQDFKLWGVATTTLRAVRIVDFDFSSGRVCYLRRNTDVTFNSGWQLVTFESAPSKTAGWTWWNAALASKAVCKEPGEYRITATLRTRVDSGYTGNDCDVMIKQYTAAGVVIDQKIQGAWTGNSTYLTELGTHITAYCALGDYFEVYTRGIARYNHAMDYCILEIEKLSNNYVSGAGGWKDWSNTGW